MAILCVQCRPQFGPSLATGATNKSTKQSRILGGGTAEQISNKEPPSGFAIVERLNSVSYPLGALKMRPTTVPEIELGVREQRERELTRDRLDRRALEEDQLGGGAHLPPRHSITSSARASSMGGISMP